MTYGLIVDTPSGIRKIDETGLGYYRVEFQGITTQNTTTLPGNVVGPDRVLAVSNIGYETSPGWWAGSPLTGFYYFDGTNTILNAYVGMPYLILSRVGWSSGGWGLSVMGPAGDTLFNSNDTFFAITSVLNIGVDAEANFPFTLGVHAGKRPYYLASGLGARLITFGGPLYEYTQWTGFHADFTSLFMSHDWNNMSRSTTLPYPSNDFITIPIGVVL